MQTKPQKQHRQLMVSKCSARDCRDPARHHVKRRWLLKIKAGLQNQVLLSLSHTHTHVRARARVINPIDRYFSNELKNESDLIGRL